MHRQVYISICLASLVLTSIGLLVAPAEAQLRRMGMLGLRRPGGSRMGGRFGVRSGASQTTSSARKWSGKQSPTRKEVTINGVSRYYLLYIPRSVKPAAPMVMFFHGGGGTAEFADWSAGGMARLADREGFIVVYPSGIDKHWTDGRSDQAKSHYDDVKFASRIICDLTEQGLVDPKRVYATGISNGGFFSQYLAMRMPGKIAAVASVAASVVTDWTDLNVQPVRILMLLGSDDRLVPWHGGEIGGTLIKHTRGSVLSEEETVKFWLTRNGNSAQPTTEQLADKDPRDGSRVVVDRYGTAGSANEVLVYKIEGGGHTWPGGAQYLPKALVGPVCRDFDGNQVIWDFFSGKL